MMLLLKNASAALLDLLLIQMPLSANAVNLLLTTTPQLRLAFPAPLTQSGTSRPTTAIVLSTYPSDTLPREPARFAPLLPISGTDSNVLAAHPEATTMPNADAAAPAHRD
jgi:hypothetical protein